MNTNRINDYKYENGYQFIKYKNNLDSKINKKVSEVDYKKGIRYLKIKLMGNISDKKKSELKEIDPLSKNQRKFCRICETDIINLDLTQENLDKGYRYLKINLPFKSFEQGWLTQSDIDEGWKIAGNRKDIRRTRLKKVFKKKYIPKKKNKDDLKLMEEVKQYITVK